ncbi:sel1 repeat family protein [Caballeronia mineralivorans]|uniref:sel1 repeat family protein n=1 Tax=Caballeronia mineralivorans TaxID=2010198 RepID=UPI0023F42CCA|nr:sel1 repeat family protein [Caballeronia mineralivorans]MDB5781355.1 hypothetical protein [Caballeronia mineralivorans]
MAEVSWFNQIDREWAALTRHDPGLDIEKFYRHVLSAYKSGFAPLESIASTANALLVSALPGAAYLGRKMLAQVGVDKHPALRVTYALSLLSGTGGEADYALGHRVLRDVLKDEHAPDKLKGLSAAALGDSARLGRGEEADLELAKAQYEIAFELGMRDAAHTLGLYWENCWGGAAPGDNLPNRPRALQWYKRGGAASQKGMARLEALSTNGVVGPATGCAR